MFEKTLETLMQEKNVLENEVTTLTESLNTITANKQNAEKGLESVNKVINFITGKANGHDLKRSKRIFSELHKQRIREKAQARWDKIKAADKMKAAQEVIASAEVGA